MRILKALHYVRWSFKHLLIPFESLINIGKKLDQYDAAMGSAYWSLEEAPELSEAYKVQEAWSKLDTGTALVKYGQRLEENSADGLLLPAS